MMWYQEYWKHINNADYEAAVISAESGLHLFPDDTYAYLNYYSVLADYALTSDGLKFKKLHAEAIAGMKKYLKRISGRCISEISKKIFKNEFYYQTKQFKKQYYLGHNRYKRNGDKWEL